MKNILITGGTSGIGLATALEMNNETTNVIVVGRNIEKNAKVQAKYPALTVLLADLSNNDDIKKLISEIKSRFGTIDTLFSNAGYGIFKPFADITEQDFDNMVNTNYKGTFFLIQNALSILKDGGNIIINTSWTYRRGLADSSLYSSTKAALAYLVKSLSLELSTRNIRVNAVSPGYTNTEQFNESQIENDHLKHMLHTVPLHRFADASEIAKVVSFLSSEASSYVNGQDILIDGGLTSVQTD